MASGGLFVTWRDTKPGRESLAAELYVSTLSFYQSKVGDGTIESFEPVLLHRHAGDLNGFFLIRGNRAKLDEWRHSDEFLQWTLRATYCLDGFGVIDAYVQEGVNKVMQTWAQNLPKR